MVEQTYTWPKKSLVFESSASTFSVELQRTCLIQFTWSTNYYVDLWIYLNIRILKSKNKKNKKKNTNTGELSIIPLPEKFNLHIYYSFITRPNHFCRGHFLSCTKKIA